MNRSAAMFSILLLAACATMPEATRRTAVDAGSSEAEAQSLGLGTNATGQNTTGALIVEPKPVYENKSRKDAAINTDPVLRTLGFVAEAGLYLIRF